MKPFLLLSALLGICSYTHSSLLNCGCEPGPPGNVGPVGESGLKGAQGLPGAIGPAGLPGKIGLKGQPGDLGSTNFPALPGLPSMGPTGVKGAKGLPGPQGPAGACSCPLLPGFPDEPALGSVPNLGNGAFFNTQILGRRLGTSHVVTLNNHNIRSYMGRSAQANSRQEDYEKLYRKLTQRAPNNLVYYASPSGEPILLNGNQKAPTLTVPKRVSSYEQYRREVLMGEAQPSHPMVNNTLQLDIQDFQRSLEELRQMYASLNPDTNGKRIVVMI